MCKGGSSSSPGTSTNTVVQQNTPPANVLHNYQQAFDIAANAVNQGAPPTYPGQLVATNPYLPGAASNTLQLSQDYLPYSQQAQGYYGQATQPLWAGVPSFNTSGLPSQGIANVNSATGNFAPMAEGYGAGATSTAQAYGNQATDQARAYANLATNAAGAAPGIAAGYGNLATNAAGTAPGIAGNAGNLANAAAGTAPGIASGYGNLAIGAAGTAPGIAGQYGNLATRAANTAPGLAGQYGNLATRAAGSAPSLIGTYMSPYTQAVVNATQRQFNNQNAIQQSGVVGNAAAQGAWGGDRSAVAQGIVAGQQQLAQAPVIAGLEQQGYLSAEQAAQQQAALQTQAGISAGQLGVTGAGLAAQTGLGAGQLGIAGAALPTQAALEAGQLGITGAGLQAQTGLGAGQLGISGAGLQAQTGLGAGQLGVTGAGLQAQTGLGAGQLATGTSLGAGQLGTQANLGAGQTALGAGQLSLGAGQGLLGEYNTQQQAQLGANEANAWLASQAAAGTANLGLQNYNVDLGSLNAQIAAGGLQQQTAQAQLNVPYQQFLAQQAFPYQAAQLEAGIAEGTGSLSGGTSSTTSPGASLLSQGLGLGIGGAGLIGATGGFGSNGWLTGAGGLLGPGIPEGVDFSSGALGAAALSGIGPGAASAVPPALDALSSSLLAFGGVARGGAIPHRQDGGPTPSLGIAPTSGNISPSFMPGNYNIPDVSVSVIPPMPSRGIGPGPPRAPSPAPGTPNAITPQSALQMLNSIGTIRNLSQNSGSMRRGGGIMGYDEGGDVLDLPDVSVTAPPPQTAPSSGIVPSIASSNAPTSPTASYRPDPWLALAAAGFGAAAGRSPQPMQNLGAGALQGLQFYEQQREVAPRVELEQAEAQKARMEAEYYKGFLEYDQKHPPVGQLFDNLDQAALDHKASAQPPTGEQPLGPRVQGTQLAQLITGASTDVGIPPILGHATAGIESKYGANTGNKISPSNTGVFQIAPADAPGGTNDTIQNQVTLGVQKLAEERAKLRMALGREPTNAEVYLAHQQGPTGAALLLSNPDKPAGEVVSPVNIHNNGGDPRAPASAFTNMWAQKYAQAEQNYGGNAQPSSSGATAGLAPFNPAFGSRQKYDDFQQQYGQYNQVINALKQRANQMAQEPRGTFANPFARDQMINQILGQIQQQQANLIKLRETDPWFGAYAAGMKTQATKDVELRMNPPIAAATKQAEEGQAWHSLRPGQVGGFGGNLNLSSPTLQHWTDAQGNQHPYYARTPGPGEPAPAGMEPPNVPRAGATPGAGNAVSGSTANAPPITSKIGPESEEILKGMGEEERNFYAKTLADSDAARYQQASLYRMKEDAQNMYVGPWANHVQTATSFLRLVDPRFDKQVQSFDDYVKNSSTLVRQATREASPRASFQEMKFIGTGLPNPEMSPKGLQSVQDEYIGLNDYRMAKAKAQGDWITTHGSPLGFEQDWQSHGYVTPYTYIINRMDLTPEGRQERQELFAKWGQSPEGRTALQALARERMNMINMGLEPQQ